MGKSDGGFEYDIRDKLRKAERYIQQDTSKGYNPERIPQSKRSKQHIDVVVHTPVEDLHMAVECKSRQVGDGEPWKFYFKGHFRGEEKVREINNWINKGGFKGYLAGAFRRGRGKKVKKYIMPWNKVMEICTEKEQTYIHKDDFLEYGVEITDSIEPFVNELI